MSKAFEAARAAAAEVDPQHAARAAGLSYVGDGATGEFEGTLFGAPVVIVWPELTVSYRSGETVPPHMAALVLYNLSHAAENAVELGADGTCDETERAWIAFSDLPEGSFYVTAWRGYTGEALARAFGNRLDDLKAALDAAGARHVRLTGDISVEFSILPRVNVALVYWAGDDEFPARADVLFAQGVEWQLPTDCSAVMCAFLVGQICGRDPARAPSCG